MAIDFAFFAISSSKAERTESFTRAAGHQRWAEAIQKPLVEMMK